MDPELRTCTAFAWITVTMPGGWFLELFSGEKIVYSGDTRPCERLVSGCGGNSLNS